MAFIDILLKSKDYSPEHITQTLRTNYNFYMLQMQKANFLVEKIITVAGLEHHYYWLNEILRSVDRKTAAAITPKYLNQPIPDSVFSFKSTFAGELVFTQSLHRPENLNSEYNPFKSFTNDDKQKFLN